MVLALPSSLVLLVLSALVPHAAFGAVDPAGQSCSPADPFRALGGERFGCWTCGESIDARAAKCKDVCSLEEEWEQGTLPEGEASDDVWEGTSTAEMVSRHDQLDESQQGQPIPSTSTSTGALQPPASADLTPSLEDQRSGGPTTSLARSTTPLPASDDSFLSFEDWKALQLAKLSSDGSSAPAVNFPSSLVDGHPSIPSPVLPDPLALNQSHDGRPSSPSSASSSSASSIAVKSLTPSPAVKSPSRRFNYASLDCSARIHFSSSQTRSPSAILHKSKDRYMLTPCAAKSHYVVIELCDEIRLDTLEVGNFEFFSSVVKDVRVRAGESEGEGREDEEGWKDLGTFRMGNTRGMQSFKFDPPTGFHRFLRLDFLGRYGTEYYCPVSLVRVYGLNQMEAYRYELGREVSGKEAEGQAEPEMVSSTLLEESPHPAPPLNDSTPNLSSSILSPSLAASPTRFNSDFSRIAPTPDPSQVTDVRPESFSGPSPTFTPFPSSQSPSSSSHVRASTDGDQEPYDQSSTSQSKSAASPSSTGTSTATVGHSKSESLAQSSSANVSSTSLSSSIGSSALEANSSSSHAPTSSSQLPSPSPSSSRQAPPPSSSSAAANQRPPPAPRPVQAHPQTSDSGESIYSSIVRRLAYLETTSLYATSYVEEQSRMVRDVLVKLEKDLKRLEGWEREEKGRWAGGLEGLRAQQERMLKTTAREWDAQRREVEKEHRELAHRLALLNSEIVVHRWLVSGTMLLLLVLLAAFFAIRIGSVEMVPVPEVVSRAAARVSKEKNRRSTGDIYESARRRAASPLLRGSPRSDSPALFSEGVSTPFMPSSTARPRLRLLSGTPTKRSISLANSFASPSHVGRSAETVRTKSTLISGSHRKAAAREAHIHTLANHARLQALGGHVKKRSIGGNGHGFPATGSEKSGGGGLGSGDQTPKRKFGTLLVNHANNVVGVGLGISDGLPGQPQRRRPEEDESDVSGSDEKSSAYDEGWTPASTDDEGETSAYTFLPSHDHSDGVHTDETSALSAVSPGRLGA